MGMNSQENRVWVGSLSKDTTSQELKNHMGRGGNVVRVRIYTTDGTETGPSKGVGWVAYSTREEADLAIVILNGSNLAGRKIQVDNWTKPGHQRDSETASKVPPKVVPAKFGTPGVSPKFGSSKEAIREREADCTPDPPAPPSPHSPHSNLQGSSLQQPNSLDTKSCDPSYDVPNSSSPVLQSSPPSQGDTDPEAIAKFWSSLPVRDSSQQTQSPQNLQSHNLQALQAQSPQSPHSQGSVPQDTGPRVIPALFQPMSPSSVTMKTGGVPIKASPPVKYGLVPKAQPEATYKATPYPKPSLTCPTDEAEISSATVPSPKKNSLFKALQDFGSPDNSLAQQQAFVPAPVISVPDDEYLSGGDEQIKAKPNSLDGRVVDKLEDGHFSLDASGMSSRASDADISSSTVFMEAVKNSRQSFTAQSPKGYSSTSPTAGQARAMELFGVSAEEDPLDWTPEGFVDDLLDAAETAVNSDPNEGLARFELLSHRAVRMPGYTQIEIINQVGTHVSQLRHYYSPKLASILSGFLERVANAPSDFEFPTVGVLKLLDGFCLLCCCSIPDARRVVRILEKLLQQKRFSSHTHIRMESTLAILAEYIPLRPLPYLAEDVNARLAATAMDLLPKAYEMDRMQMTMQRVRTVVSRLFEGHEPQFFGSTVNGFQHRASDIDCVILLAPKLLEMMGTADTVEEDTPEARKRAACVAAVSELANELREGDSCGLEVIEEVCNAVVPILKCTSEEGIEVDISFCNELPIHNSALLRMYADWDPRVGQLGMLVKQWARQRGVNDAKEGTLSSYGHILLVIHFLQRHGVVPNLQDRNAIRAGNFSMWGNDELLDGVHDVWFIDPKKRQGMPLSLVPDILLSPAPTTEETTLSSLFSGFFRYYAYEFPFCSHLASIRQSGGLQSKLDYFVNEAEHENSCAGGETLQGFRPNSGIEPNQKPPLLEQLMQSSDAGGEKVYTGVLKSYEESKGFGFIKSEELLKEYGRDAFLHKNQFAQAGNLAVGDRVTFTIHVRQGNPQVADVKRVPKEELPPASKEPIADAAAPVISGASAKASADEDMEENVRAKALFKLGGRHAVFIGTIKSYDEVKGFGFVKNESLALQFQGRDAFLHKQQLGSLRLAVGDPCVFKVEIKQGNPQARSVTPLKENGDLPDALIEDPTADLTAMMPAKRRVFALPATAQDSQKRMQSRQTLCIEDPIEKRRTLGTSFQGMDRLCFEFRRAFEILSDKEGVTEEHWRTLFQKEDSKSLHQLCSNAEAEFPSIIDDPEQKLRTEYIVHALDLQRFQIGKILGVKGSTAEMLRQTTGVERLHVDDIEKGTHRHKAILKLHGQRHAVERCLAKIHEIIY